jgi:hypothetical protein
MHSNVRKHVLCTQEIGTMAAEENRELQGHIVRATIEKESS